ncbi:MAG: hypothetical protein V3U17_00545 [Thermoplasmata archaeon]
MARSGILGLVRIELFDYLRNEQLGLRGSRSVEASCLKTIDDNPTLLPPLGRSMAVIVGLIVNPTATKNVIEVLRMTMTETPSATLTMTH